MILTIPASSTPQTVVDKAEIKELLEFERFCRDNALWDEMKRCFAAESQVTISWFQGSGYDFVEQSSQMKGRAPHKIYNTAVWVNGDKAVAIMMVTIEKRTNVNGTYMDLKSDAKLLYRTQRIDGRWQIRAMQAIYEQDSLVPVIPSAEGALIEDALHGLRGSYACLSYVLGRSGYAIDGELPGIDRPELVEQLYQEADKWLCS